MISDLYDVKYFRIYYKKIKLNILEYTLLKNTIMCTTVLISCYITSKTAIYTLFVCYNSLIT